MTQAIELGAIISREGELFLVRPIGDEFWRLPGGPFRPDEPDIDATMDALLLAHGVHPAAIEEDFLQTVHLPGSNGPVVYNMYGPTEWRGEPAPLDGWEGTWSRPEELGDLPMQSALRQAVWDVFGMSGEEYDEGLLENEELMLAQVIESMREIEDTEISLARAGSMRFPEMPAAPAFGRAAQPTPFEDDLAMAFDPGGGRREAGLDVLRTISGGDPQVAADRMARTQPELAGDIIDFALGEVWTHPALDRKTRSLEVVAMLAAMGGKSGPLRSHMNGALNHGATPDQLAQTLRMVAVYAGFPAALEAWPILESVFEARGIPRPGRPA
ncbi:MAG: carboxymuconolactone decarboxylase family protein [Dehalococcoidia bacterium]